MSQQHGCKAHGQAARHVGDGHEQAVAFGKGGSLVDEGGKSGEAPAEACGEQQTGGGRGMGGDGRHGCEQADEETAGHIHHESAHGKSPRQP